MEFEAKPGLSIDEKGMACLERGSFDACNESEVLMKAIEGYKGRTGYYPQNAMTAKKTEYTDSAEHVEIEHICP